MREEKITIFNKNGITLEKILTHENKPLECKSEIIKVIGRFQPPPRYYRKKNLEYTEIRCVSKLGFYYTKKVKTVDIKKEEEEENLSKTIRKVIISGLDKNWVYNLTYLIEYHGVGIGYEIRPWDLIGGSFPDNYMWGLLEDINKLFDNLENYKTVECEKNVSSVRDLRRSVITELFGNPEGPKFQTNDEKILAHGFDLKTSFRNVKA